MDRQTDGRMVEQAIEWPEGGFIFVYAQIYKNVKNQTDACGHIKLKHDNLLVSGLDL